MKTATELRTLTATDLVTSVPLRGIELPAVVAISWSLAGGMLLGGGAVVALLSTDRLSGHLLMVASAALFVLGAALGLVHGALLGVLGRPLGTTPRQAVAAMVHGLLYLVPALLLGWLTAGWVAALPIAVRTDRALATVISVGAWVVMIATLYFAGSAGLAAAKLAYQRWPDRVPGTLLVGGTLVALLVSAAIQPPTIPFTPVRLTGVGAVTFAFAATFWFYGPIVTAGLALLRRVRPLLPPSRFRRSAAWRDLIVRAAIAVVAGLGVALLAVPFHEGVLGLPTNAERIGLVQAGVLAVTDALTDELLLRLFLFTAAFVLALRYLPPHPSWAVGVAVAAAAVADLVIHWPAVPGLGLPSVTMIAAYTVTRLAIPAVLFGYLFWRRGLGTAVTAHAAAGAALGLLAL